MVLPVSSDNNNPVLRFSISLVGSSEEIDFFGASVEGLQGIGVSDNSGNFGSGRFRFPTEAPFTFATAAPVPVPAAVWLFGSALGLLGWMRRKRR